MPDEHKIPLSHEDRVKILLQLEKTATDQMMEIKRDEMSWLRIFLVFYSAVIAWGVHRWLGADKLNSSELTMIYSVSIFSCIATAVFYWLFMNRRWSYYGVAKRLVRVQDILRLYDSTTWNGTAPLRDADKIATVTGFSTWYKNTKPLNSFITRLLYVAGANVTVLVVACLALNRIHPNTSCFVVTLLACTILNIFGLSVVMWFDFRNFYKRGKSQT